MKTNELNEFLKTVSGHSVCSVFFSGNRSSFALNDNSRLSIPRDSQEGGTEVALLEKKKGAREGLLPLGNQ